jgi:uncharacterized membrane protein YphA (DoxX/SURF4 family)
MRWRVRLEQLYGESRRNKWFRHFAVFCRVALALGFVPSGLVKLRGERFTGLPPNNPLGHYFDALFLTGYYYTFIGVSQLLAAVLLLIPRTALLGAILYFPIILNITVLAYATRFEGVGLRPPQTHPAIRADRTRSSRPRQDRQVSTLVFRIGLRSACRHRRRQHLSVRRAARQLSTRVHERVQVLAQQFNRLPRFL